MRFLIVLAHHEPTSFNGAMTREAEHCLKDAGHDVLVSDLYAMNFNPVSDRSNFMDAADTSRLDQQAEEKYAALHDSFAPALQAEMDKLAWCDVLILQFPIWWLGPPAILKGWLDRVFAVGRAYGGGRWFDRGRMSGKRAMLSVTMGGPNGAYTEEGIYGASAMSILHPINHGTLGFVGFSVIEPFIVYGPGRMDDVARSKALADFRARLLCLENAQILPMPRSEDYHNFVPWRHAL
ncbi:NAD(P)H-dependent oxidoreductase [Aquisediminimonas profunda]|uniref:NAD(P)H-dependent oxidoreductase n=1 Tax=Aquisediminimonas profunda TaxID=1550733 RepID=UPI001C635EEF|nr:NAD(P)H-dependent oxidoreductase [Aquisediminimonas profunda]